MFLGFKRALRRYFSYEPIDKILENNYEKKERKRERKKKERERKKERKKEKKIGIYQRPNSLRSRNHL